MTIQVPIIASISPDAGVAVGDFNIVTDANVLTLVGTAAANATVAVFSGTTLLASTVVDGSGNWSLTTGQLANGSYSFTATAIDAAGDSSAPSTAVNVTIVTDVPAAPVVASATVGTDNVLSVTGTAGANDTVDVYDGTNLLGTTVASAAGNWSFSATLSSAGAHDITATATDAAGLTSAPSPDPVAVSPPVILTASPQNVPLDKAGSSTSYSDIITLVGTAAANSTITVYDGATELRNGSYQRQRGLEVYHRSAGRRRAQLYRDRDDLRINQRGIVCRNRHDCRRNQRFLAADRSVEQPDLG